MAKADDPYDFVCRQIFAAVFGHFARASGRPAKAVARGAGIAEGYLSQIGHAQRLPSLDKAGDLDREIGADGCLFEVRRLLDRLQTQRATNGNNAGKAPPSGEEEDPMRRRTLLQDSAALAAGATVAPVLSVLTQAWQDSEPAPPGASVSRAMVDDWEEAATLHAKRARRDEHTIVLAALAADFTDMAPHLRRTQPEAMGRDLSHAAARHASLIAGKWSDLGNRREAHRWWSKARALADRSGDSLLASWLRCMEAIHRRGDPREDVAQVMAVIREARRLAGEVPSAPLVAAMSAEAKALALMGDHEFAVTTLHEAERVFDRLPSIDSPFRMFSDRELWFDQSLIYTMVGDRRRATAAQDTADRLYDPADQASPRIGMHRAAIHARCSPREGLAEAARIVSEVPGGRRMTRYASDAQIVLDALPDDTARALPAAQELRALTAA